MCNRCTKREKEETEASDTAKEEEGKDNEKGKRRENAISKRKSLREATEKMKINEEEDKTEDTINDIIIIIIIIIIYFFSACQHKACRLRNF